MTGEDERGRERTGKRVKEKDTDRNKMNNEMKRKE